MKTSLTKLQEGLNVQRLYLEKLKSIKHIDSIELKDYGLKDARKIADALGLVEQRNYRNVVTSFSTPGEYEYGKDHMSISRGKPYDFSECSVIKIYIRVYADVVNYYGEINKDSFIESFELGGGYAKHAKRTIADCIKTQKRNVAEYEKAIATFTEFEAKEKEWNEYYINASYLLR